jgi:glycosyltransferase involved in cell wall biosynthesis
MTKKTKQKLFLIGTFPPPVTGMATTTESIYERIKEHQVQVIKINTSPRDLRRSTYSRLSRLPHFFKAWIKLAKEAQPKNKLYVPISGELGQIYDLVTIAIAKLKGMQCFISHHSFAYLDKPNLLTKILFHLAGRETLHITRCKRMKDMLAKQYKINNMLILTNLDLRFQPSRTITTLTKIGYISNITRDKGGHIILELAYAIRENNIPIKLIVAGPCYETELSKNLKRAEKEGVLEWIGAVYDNDKKYFWNNIDAFVFPTQYVNEAEPRVVWESISHGIPVISYERGCISEQIKNSGIIISQQENFVDAAIAILKKWSNDRASFEIYTNAGQEYYKRMQNIVNTQWEEFIHYIEKEQ